VPRFHLHVRNGFGFAEDEEGQDLADPDHARAVAIDGARSLLASELATGRLDLRGQVEIADANGHLLEVVPFEEAVEIRTGPLPGSGRA